KEWREEEFRKFNFDTLGWKSMHAYSEPMFIYYHIHSAYADYPAVNISYEGAIAYCKWLTEEYAKNPKKKYNKVVFRLPTEGEWKFAARGNRDNYTYPWGGPHATNSQGMRLANFLRLYEANMRDTIINGKRMAIGLVGYDFADGLNYDGFTFTPVASYWPNHLGLYNVSGNASEMLSEKGRTKGGNWRSLGYYARIDAPDEFGGQMMEPSPLVGFRVFAEIVE
ncbi:MAG TPA: SUMF1/EgtB/PvdO family nonheme iron enzyme, partial [Bacteroidia bacterium]|nr:SUMF1/EgtB/PvdO family nonheme iron enzyme [Bacteroidia bacterium]